MEKELQQLVTEITGQINQTPDSKSLQMLYLSVFGQNGRFTGLIKGIKDVPAEKRPAVGKLINQAKSALEKLFTQKKTALGKQSQENFFDVTMPGVPPPQGHLHLVTQAIEEITNIFTRIGFTRMRYPEVEWEWYAFEALNMSDNSPARDDFETFFINQPKHDKYGKLVLSPHTSSGQVREMERAGKPPIRMINISKCYRPNWDISHTPMFHQFEGLVIDKGINITHLKGTFDYFAGEFFGRDRKTRLRPFHFQFTEPSFEVDITCDVCGGYGCRLCKEGWLELGGAGMVHPNVLKSGNIDPDIYTGYAFGWGVERTYMMKAGIKIDDLRIMYGNDIRFLEQF